MCINIESSSLNEESENLRFGFPRWKVFICRLRLSVLGNWVGHRCLAIDETACSHTANNDHNTLPRRFRRRIPSGSLQPVNIVVGPFAVSSVEVIIHGTWINDSSGASTVKVTQYRIPLPCMSILVFQTSGCAANSHSIISTEISPRTTRKMHSRCTKRVRGNVLHNRTVRSNIPVPIVRDSIATAD